MRRIAVLLSYLVAPALGMAAPAQFDAFDFSRCLHWSVTSDSYTDPTVDPAADKAFQAAVAALERLRAELGPKGEEWAIYAAFDNANPSATQKYGACKESEDRRTFQCLLGFDFPLSGTRFDRIRSKGQLPSFRCAAGCSRADIGMLHDMGYENMEGEQNLEREQLLARFSRACKGKPGQRPSS